MQEMSPVMSHEDFVSSVGPGARQQPVGHRRSRHDRWRVRTGPSILWNPSSGELNTIADLTRTRIDVVTFSSDSSLLAAASGSTIFIWDTASFEQSVSRLSPPVDDRYCGADFLAGRYQPGQRPTCSGTITLWQVP